MKIIIIEDEATVAESLVELLGKLSYTISSIKLLSSITDADLFFKTNHNYNFIFCNVKIEGVNSFDIFKKSKIKIPVIYYADNAAFAMEAYRYNAIGYMLKPINKKEVIASIEKYKSLFEGFDHDNILLHTPEKTNADSSLIITWKDKIIPVKIKEIALFNIEYKMTQAVTFNNRKYFIANTLEDLEEICGVDFYRANRQFLVNREAVSEAAQHFARKLVLKLKIEGEYEIIISKNRVPEFLSWLRK